MAYLLSGIKSNRLTFKDSCLCFKRLCKDCPGVLAQVIYSEENISQLLDIGFVAEWDNSNSYTDIVEGLGCLITEIYKTNRA